MGIEDLTTLHLGLLLGPSAPPFLGVRRMRSIEEPRTPWGRVVYASVGPILMCGMGIRYLSGKSLQHTSVNQCLSYVPHEALPRNSGNCCEHQKRSAA